MNADLRRLIKLYKQQFWLFGWDVRRPQGNLLVNFGFVRTPVPAGGKVKSSRYHLDRMDGSTVTLWSFGACWSSSTDGSIYLSRLDPRPRFCPDSSLVPDVWWPDDMAMFRRPANPTESDISNRLLLDFLTWLSRYEAEVLDRCGVVYRQEAIDAWRDPIGDANTVASDWERQRALIEQMIGSQVPV